MSRDTTQFESMSLERAWQLYRFHKYKLALNAALEFLGVYPNSSDAYCLLALIHAKEKSRAEAFKMSRKAIALQPDSGYAHYIDGFVAYQFDQNLRAEQSLEEALRLHSTNTDYLSMLAEVQHHRGKLNKALETARRGLQFDASHVGCMYQQGVALWSLNKKAEAEQVLREVLRIDSQHSQAQGYIGRLETERGNYKEGLHLLRNCLRENPQWTMAQENWKEAIRKHYIWYRLPCHVANALSKWKGFLAFMLLPFFMVL